MRFDIYERIILAEDLPGIEELEEAELIPHIKVIHQGEQAALRGHLLLAGLYKGDTIDQESEPLEHWIPVEITVPMNRVTALEDIAVEIENFDVDLLSRRSLNITGVLSLKGIQAGAQGYAGQEMWKDEEFTVVHAPADVLSESASETRIEDAEQQPEELMDVNVSADDDEFKAAPAFIENGADYIRDFHEPQDRIEMTEPEHAPDFSKPSVWNFERGEETAQGWQRASDFDEIREEQEKTTDAVHAEVQEELLTEQALLGEDEEESVETAATEHSELTEAAAKPGLKVAFSTKNSTADQPSGVGFSSLLHSSRSIQEVESSAAPEEEAAPHELETQAADDVQWKSLFLGSRQEDTPFRKVRLCIVQREETLEVIAERYQLSPRELLLYNRLSEQGVEEGQILYIP
nr:LysM peptidoglycan-binding domain-containing protein [Paenibacillus lemnae]